MALVLSGSIDISGSMTATTILVSSPGAAGMVSSSAQITELAPLMAYTASLKGAAIVSSSQQIQNYFTFARTGSVNTFFGNQGISGSLNVTSATGTNVIPQLTVTNTTTNGYGILRLVGAARGGIIDFYNTSSAQASITANDGALQIYTNGDSSGTPKVTVTNDGYLRLAGAGIQFNGDTAAANSLDDYEEGTFTPTIVYSTTNTPSYYGSGQLGRYTKVGRIVQVQIYLNWNENGSVGNISVSGLPFTSINSQPRATASIFSFGFVTLSSSMAGIVDPNSTNISLFIDDNSGNAPTAANTDADQDLYITVIYEVV